MKKKLLFVMVLVVVTLVSGFVGYQMAQYKCNKESHLLVYEAQRDAIEKTIKETEKLINTYNDSSTVFNTFGDWDNYDELWGDVPNGHIRFLNLYGRLWISYEEDFQKWGSRSR